MCIICAKKKGVAMPSWSTIENMWQGNRDGAGLMWTENGVVHITKGYMNYESFKNELDSLGERLDLTETPLVMHFRITTHGGTKPENCHPFPITDQIGLMQKLRCNTDVGIAHNGILSFTPRKGISDTMEYIAMQLSIIKKIDRKFLVNERLMQLIKNATEGSRLCFLDKTGRIYTTGNFIEDNEILYSNSSYMYSPFYSSNKKTKTKLLCHIEDADMFVRDSKGKSVTSAVADFYVDYAHDVYAYSFVKDEFMSCPNMQAFRFSDDSEGFSWKNSILVDVVQDNEYETDDFWTEALCPFEGTIVYSEDEEEWGGVYLVDAKGKIYEEVEDGCAIPLHGAKALTYEGLPPVYCDRNSEEYLICEETTYFK